MTCTPARPIASAFRRWAGGALLAAGCGFGGAVAAPAEAVLDAPPSAEAVRLQLWNAPIDAAAPPLGEPASPASFTASAHAQVTSLLAAPWVVATVLPADAGAATPAGPARPAPEPAGYAAIGAVLVALGLWSMRRSRRGR